MNMHIKGFTRSIMAMPKSYELGFAILDLIRFCTIVAPERTDRTSYGDVLGTG